MTRTEVARYLGKSVATVRRIEGVHLHPRRDEHGVHHFALEEVRALAGAMKRAEVRLTSVNFGTATAARKEPARSRRPERDSTAQLRDELAEVRTLAGIAVDLLFKTAPGRILRRLDPELLDALAELGEF